MYICKHLQHVHTHGYATTASRTAPPASNAIRKWTWHICDEERFNRHIIPRTNHICLYTHARFY